MRSLSRCLAAAASLLVLSIAFAPTSQAAKPAWGPDVARGADHPLVKRFTGSWLIGHKVSEWDQTKLPIGMKVENHRWMQTIQVEGKITRLFYLAPVGKSRLEVHRNYEQALLGAGLKKKFSCEKDCTDLYFALDDTTSYRKAVRWVDGGIPQARSDATYPIDDPLSFDEARILYGTLNRGGQELHVLLYTSVASNDTTDIAATYLQIVEPKAMQTGQVTVDANAMKSGLAAEGKVALYGLYFDTGRSEVKPESKAQLDEMAKLLQSQPALKVYIVGHTDNQGAEEGNMALSQQRATAVANALATTYRIDPKRLKARGAASIAPVATNASEEGRAKNRRVELVAQ